MGKRFFIGYWVVLILVSIFFLTLNALAVSPKVIELKMAHIMPTKHVQHVHVMVPFAEDVNKATEGRVKITIYPGGVLAKAPDQFDAAAAGITDFAYGVQAYTPGKFPLTSVLELPFLFTSGAHGTKVFWELWENIPELRKEYPGVKVCWLWTGDTGQLFTTKKQVRTMSDFKGLKIRTHSMVLKSALELLGAVPVTMPIPELYENLQKGVIDGCITPWSAVYDFSLYEVVRFATMSNFYIPAFFMVMNPSAFGRLSPNDQKILERMMGKPMGEKAAKVYDDAAQLGIDSLKKAGATIYPLPPEEMERWEKTVDPVYKKWINDMEAKGLPGKKVYEETRKLAKKYLK